MDWRPLTIDDTPAWSKLIDEVSATDETSEHFSAEDLAEELDDGCLGVFDGDELVAFGQLVTPVRRHDGTVRATFLGAVRPSARGRGIGTELLHRLETQIVERARSAFPDSDPPPATHAFVTATSARALLEAHDYAVLRWFHDMARAPSRFEPDPRVRPYDDAFEVEVRAAHTAAFADHWGSAPPSDEAWASYGAKSRTFRPVLSRIVVADGRVIAYSLVYQFEPDVVWIGQLGVRAEARGQGLGRAALLATLSAAADAGVPTVKLSVDTENPSGAGRLYESAGFTVETSFAAYEKRR